MKSPMLAETLDNLANLRYPTYASPKIDGFRVFKYAGTVYVGRRLQPIKCRVVHDLLTRLPIDYVDGELTIPGLSFNEMSGELRRYNATPFVKWTLFDSLEQLNQPFNVRLQLLKFRMLNHKHPQVELIQHSLIIDEADAAAIVNIHQYNGYEGTMFRSPNGTYKHGRSTLSEQGMLKWKPFEDDEAVIVDFVEQLENTNPSFLGATGHTERTSHAIGQIPKDTLGSLIVKWKDQLFHIGTGFTDELRKLIWSNRSHYIGKTVTFKYQKHGMLTLPRSPVFKCFRTID